MKTEESKLREIYEEYAADIYRFIYSRCGRREDSEDILTDTFIALNQVLDKFTGESSIKTFVIGIAINKIRQYWQKHSIKELSLDLEGEQEFSDALERDYQTDPALLAEEKDESQVEIEARADLKSTQVSTILNALPENYKTVIQCRFLDGMSIKETALFLKLSQTNVTSLQQRALAKARELFNN